MPSVPLASPQSRLPLAARAMGAPTAHPSSKQQQRNRHSSMSHRSIRFRHALILAASLVVRHGSIHNSFFKKSTTLPNLTGELCLQNPPALFFFSPPLNGRAPLVPP